MSTVSITLLFSWRASSRPQIRPSLHAVFDFHGRLETPQVQNGDRKCTDVLFLLLLFAAWAAMTLLGLIVTGLIPDESLEPGDPRRLINGIDYDGRICGVDTDVEVSYSKMGKVGCIYIYAPSRLRTLL